MGQEEVRGPERERKSTANVVTSRLALREVRAQSYPGPLGDDTEWAHGVKKLGH